MHTKHSGFITSKGIGGPQVPTFDLRMLIVTCTVPGFVHVCMRQRHAGVELSLDCPKSTLLCSHKL